MPGAEVVSLSPESSIKVAPVPQPYEVQEAVVTLERAIRFDTVEHATEVFNKLQVAIALGLGVLSKAGTYPDHTVLVGAKQVLIATLSLIAS